jgi:hypothetical protein
MTRILALAIAPAILSCAGWQQSARTALSIVETACVLDHGEMFDSEAVRKTCGIADNLAPVLRDLLEARQRATLAKARRIGVCP